MSMFQNKVFRNKIFAIIQAAAGAMFSDNFQRADENPLSDGGAWNSAPGSFGGVKLVSNKAGATASSNCAGRVISPTFTANQTATVTYGGSSDVGPIVRITSSANGNCYMLYINNSTQLQYYKGTDTSSAINFVQLGTTISITALNPGDTVSLSANGTSSTILTAYVNGVAQGSPFTDSSTPFTSGQPGFFSGSPSDTITAYSATNS